MRAAFGVRSLVVVGVALSAAALLSGQTAQPTATWADVGSGASLPQGGAVVPLADGRSLILGGVDATGAPSNAALIYDPASRSAAPAGALLAGRTGHTATALSDGRVVVSGGVIGGLVSGDVEVFDVATGTSSLAAILPEPRSRHVAARVSDDAVLIAGGSGVDGAALQSAVVVDPSSGVVTALTGQLSVARVDASATALIDGRVLVAGGNDGTVDLATAELYDPYAQTFAVLATSMSVPRRGHAAVLLPHNASVLIAGGTSNGVVQAGADLFLPAEFPDPFSYGVGHFAPTGAMTAPRVAGVTTSTAVEGFAIADGGGQPNAEVYRFATIKSDKDDYAPGERALLTGTGWQPGETVRLTFQEDPPVHDDYVVDVVADEAGNLRWNEWAPEPHDVGVRFYLMATGSVAKAQTTFTDGNLFSTITFAIGPSTVAPGGSLTWAVTAICRDGGGPNTCVAEGFTAGGAVQNGYTINIQRSTSATFTSPTTVATATTSGGAAGGNVTAPASGGPYFYRAVHPNENLPNAPVTGNNPNSWQPETSNSASVTLLLDATPPVVTPTVTGTLGANGWYTSNVAITWTVTDAQSAISSSTGCDPSSVVADTAGVTFTCSATSAGGTTSASVTIKRDASAPNAPTASATPAANAAGWNNTNVTVAFAAAGDNGPSGVASCSASTLLTAETGGTPVSGTCTDNAGNVSASSSVTVKIDKTAPGAPTAGVSPPANANGWHNTDVTVSFTAGVETGSGIASCTAPTTLSAETPGTVVSGTCVDNAGNTSAATDVTVKIDKTAPAAPTSAVSPPANANGWHNTDVTVSFTAGVETGSGIASCTSSTTLTAETAGTPVSGTCTDNAGNTSASTDVTVKIDKTAPNPPTTTATPPANAAGWNNTDVTIAFVAAGDNLSGVDTCSADQPFSAETSGTPASGTCTDLAGNVSTTTTVTVKIDKTAPEAPAAGVSPPANANGWHNTDVVVSFTAGVENGSGIASCTAATTLTGETAGTPVSGTCTDNAGNTSPSTDVTVKIDKTAPNPPTATATPPANAAGWNNSDVTIAFADAGDNLSGVASCSASQSFTAETDGTPASGTCTDLAGNVSGSTTVTVKIDTTAPTITLNPVADACGVPGLLGWCRGTQTAGFTAADARSGLASGYASPFTKTSTTNGASVSIPSGQVCDVAGNCAASIDAGPFKIDSVAPELSRNAGADICSLPGSSDWCRGTQTAGFVASDATSGLAGVTSPFTQSTSVNGLAVTIPSGQVCDVAGNCTASIAAGPFKIDSVAPGIALTSRLPAANVFGWNNTAVTVAWACTDSTSGPSAPSVSATVATEGLNQNATGTCFDVAGNSASDVHGNVSIDTTAPAVAVTGVSQGAAYVLGAVPAAGCSTSDALSGVNASATLAVTGGVAPGVGTFTAACSGATDKAGNAASASATYTVQFAPAGTSCLGAPAHEVLQPINPDGTSVFKQKSTVPVKFRVCDANGVSIGANVVAAFALVQIFNGAVASDVNEEVQSTTPDTTFRFDPSAQQWIFNTNTKALQASRTYRYWITLTDGSRIEYQFGLK